MSRPNDPSSLLPWLVAAPVVLGIGVVIGRVSAPGAAAPVWREAAGPGAGAAGTGGATGVGGMPSLAPIVAAVKGGVVGIRTVRRRGGEGRPAKGGEGVPAKGGLQLAAWREGERRDVVNGTGFLIHESGLAVTNHHLVAVCSPLDGSLPVTERLERPWFGARTVRIEANCHPDAAGKERNRQ